MKLADVDPERAGTELQTTAQSLAQRLGTLTLDTRADLEQAVIDRQEIGAQIRRVEQFFEPLKAVTHNAHATICAREREILAPLRALDAARRTAITAFKERDDRERRERERELAEQQQRDQQSRAATEAAALEAQGHHEVAAAVLAEALDAPLPSVALSSATKDVAGLKFRKRYLWRYAGGPNDPSTTPGDVIARTLAVIPREFVIVDETRLGQYARAMKGAGKVAGIEFYSVDEPVR